MPALSSLNTLAANAVVKNDAKKIFDNNLAQQLKTKYYEQTSPQILESLQKGLSQQKEEFYTQLDKNSLIKKESDLYTVVKSTRKSKQPPLQMIFSASKDFSGGANKNVYQEIIKVNNGQYQWLKDFTGDSIKGSLTKAARTVFETLQSVYNLKNTLHFALPQTGLTKGSIKALFSKEPQALENQLKKLKLLN
jgi:hypothetical protein